MRQWYIICGITLGLGVLATVVHYFDDSWKSSTELPIEEVVTLAEEIVIEETSIDPVDGETVAPQPAADPIVRIGESIFRVTIADTLEERVLGLSGTPSLAPDEGKLFLFERPNRYRFWMKDMLFAIDILWIQDDGTIIDITKNAKPESYPDTTFSPSEPVRIVLEISAGESERQGISIGDVAVLPEVLR